MALSATWNLDRTGTTANELFGVGKAIFQTAYRDNVQPFALHACEKFGGTIAMSVEARDKITREVSTTIQPRTFGFVKSILGPAGGESLHALSLSIAGQNFLGLVTGLISVMSTFEAAAAVEHMMIDTAGDLMEVPGQLYIRQILDVLEPRLNRLEFLDRCHEWSKTLRLVIGIGSHYPDSDGIGQLVSAFRSIGRIGENDIDRVVISTTTCSAWVATFTEWCFGDPPSIFDSSGSLIFPQPESRISLIISSTSTVEHAVMKVEVLKTSSSLPEVLFSELSSDERGLRAISGMVSLRTHCQQTLRACGADIGTGHDAMVRSMPYALMLARLLLVESRSMPMSRGCVDNDKKDVVERNMRNEWARYRSICFPDEAIVHKTMCAYFPSETQMPELDDLPAGLPLMKLGLIQLWCREKIEKCPECQRVADGFENISNAHDQTHEDEVARAISLVVANILTLSLIKQLDGLLLYYDSRIQIRDNNFTFSYTELSGVIAAAIKSSSVTSSSVKDILNHILSLLHHEVREEIIMEEWVMSAFRGQVLYPRIFESGIITQFNTLELVCLQRSVLLKAPGSSKKGPVVAFSGQQFKIVKGHAPHPGDLLPVTPLKVSLQDIGSFGEFSNWKCEWQSRVTEDYIYAHLALDSHEKFQRTNPFAILGPLALALHPRPCAHEKTVHMSEVTNDFEILHPHSFFNVQHKKATDPIAVFAVQGNELLRIMILGAIWRNMVTGQPTARPSRPRVVIGSATCLACLLDFCRQTQSKFLLL